MTRRVVVALVAVLAAQALFALCLVSALQLLAPRNMPFGVVGSSKVVAAVTSKVSLDTIGYADKSAALGAIGQGQLYGAYVTGSTSDTLIVVPAKSFFARIELEGAFLSAAHKLSQPVTVQAAKPLPPSDPVGAVVGLLLLPLLIGGYLAAVLVFKAAGGTAAALWRVVILTAYAIVGAVLTDLIAGPLIGAYSSSHFWPLLRQGSRRPLGGAAHERRNDPGPIAGASPGQGRGAAARGSSKSSRQDTNRFPDITGSRAPRARPSDPGSPASFFRPGSVAAQARWAEALKGSDRADLSLKGRR